MCHNNGHHFIATLHLVILAPDLCDRLFSIITLTNSGFTCFYTKGFVLCASEQNRKCSYINTLCTKETCFGWKIKEVSKTKKLPCGNKIAPELLHQILGHRSTRSLLAGDIDNVWEDIELRIYPDPFCTSCQTSSMNKKARSKIPLNPKSPFKWFLWI